jgi:hypothetical protein
MSSPTDDELAHWRALADAATPGPWEHLALPEGDIRWHDVRAEGRDICGDYMTGPDAAFIAGAREAIPRLLDEVARLRAMTLAVSVDRDTIEVERDDARREAETLRSQLEGARDLHALMMHEIHEAAGVRPDGLAAILAWIEGARDAMSRDE